VLIVDDNHRVAQSLKLLLADHDVELSHGGEDAFQRLLREPFDVILCDLMMPDVDGIELYQRLLAQRPGMERKIVFMTGGAFSARARAFRDSVHNHFLDKPFRVEQLERVLAETGLTT
jgi:CheY-like chemotaxis protein